MRYSASRVMQDYGTAGMILDVCMKDYPGKKDKRKARGKLYRIETTMLIIVPSKLSGEDKPSGIAEWGENHGEELVKPMRLTKTQMPCLITYRRILADVACQKEEAGRKENIAALGFYPAPLLIQLARSNKPLNMRRL